MSTTHFGNQVVPEEEKKGMVKDVFTTVADKYDLMNDLMSFGTHRFWKRFVAERTGLNPGDRAIDVAGGTGDLARLMARKVGERGQVVIYDINREMIEVGRDRSIDRGFIRDIAYVQGDAEEIGFDDNSFHCATIGFGIRNVTHIDKAIREMMRVVKPGGRVICLEFSRPTSKLMRKLYDFYSFKVIPEVGETITGNRDAYVYLPESIRKFPDQESFKKMMEDAGLFKVKYYNLFNGVAAVHIGTKV